MKLKEAEKFEREKGHPPGTYYVAADKGRVIHIFTEYPRLIRNYCWTTGYGYGYVGSCYTGKKHWTRAIRKFTV